MQGDLDETDEAAVADARDLLDRVRRALPGELEGDVLPMLDIMERGMDAAERGEDPNQAFESDTDAFEEVFAAAEAIEAYQAEECAEAP